MADDSTLTDPRVMFAAERTLLAWIWTGLAMMGFGFIVARFGMFLRELAAARGTAFPHSPGLSVWVGFALIILGVAVNIVTATQHASVIGRLRNGLQLEPQRWSLAIIVAFLLAAIGILMTIDLVRTAI